VAFGVRLRVARAWARAFVCAAIQCRSRCSSFSPGHQRRDESVCLPLDSAAEVLVLVEPTLATFERHAAFALERAPAGRG
jgi:hypothetical protein